MAEQLRFFPLQSDHFDLHLQDSRCAGRWLVHPGCLKADLCATRLHNSRSITNKMGYGLPKRALRSRGAVLCGLLNLAPLFHIDLLSLLRKLSCGMGVFTTAPPLVSQFASPLPRRH
jgi:hypothetical protein